MQLWRRYTQPLWEVVERHFEEAEFLAESWRDALDEAGLKVEELAAGTERRLLLHLEALTLAGAPRLERLSWPALSDEDAEVSLALVAGLDVLASGEREDCGRLLSVLDEVEVDSERWIGISEALALSERPGLQDWLCACLDAGNEGSRIAGIAAALARRQTQLGPRLTTLLQSRDSHVLRAAASLAGSGDASQLQLLARLGHYSDTEVAAAAIESALVRGLPGAVESARYWAFDAKHCEFRSRARLWLGLLGLDEDQRRLIELLAEPDQRGDALWALGFCGTVAAIEAALPFMGDCQFGPLAAEVVTAIAGLPEDDDSLWLTRPPDDDDDELPDLSDEDLDVPLGLMPEELLPIPDPDSVAAWWREHGQRFATNRRWLGGEVLDDAGLARGLFQQPMRRRHALGLLVQLRSHGATRIATRNWAHTQLRTLAKETTS